MTIVTFPAQALLRCVEHTLASTAWMPCWDEPRTEPALLLVGDQGVYIMSAGVPQDRMPAPDTACYAVYANGINPKVDEFSQWWSSKREAFGGDDFVETIPYSWVEEIKKDIARGAEKIRFKSAGDSFEMLPPTTRRR